MFSTDLFPKLCKHSSNVCFVLASGSPRRRDILEKLGLPFVIRPSTFPENLDKSQYVGRPYDYVLENSKYKALDVYSVLEKESNLPGLIVGCDTVVVFEGKIYEKPKDEREAVDVLRGFSGRQHEVFSGVTLLRPPQFNINDSGVATDPIIDQFYERTLVKFGELNENLVRAYVASKEPLDKAGSYGIQGLGAVLVEKIDGDFYNVQGFPLYRFTEHLFRLFA